MQPYPSIRQPVYARNGMVATSQPLAAQAGLFILREGGNAVDAAIATAAALTVVEPTSNGIGGDLFALVWDSGEVHGLNGSGRSPALLNMDALPGGEMPTHGWLPVTVPGAPRAWADLHARFGRLPFEQVLAPAIEYARRGYALSPVLAHGWARGIQAHRQRTGVVFEPWLDTFAPSGFQPAPGALWASEAHATTLEQIARSGAADFYEGNLARRIDTYAQDTGGLLRAGDLAAHQSEWVKPISVRYQDHDVWEIPPNGQGIAALIALGILDGMDLPPTRDDEYGLHLQIEAMKLGFTDAHRYVADPAVSDVPVQQLLDPAYHAARRALIGEQALNPEPGDPQSHGTVYLATADGDGQMVSLIQSNYMGFGSGVVVPGTGIALQNRGHNFNLDASHPNALAPGKRPYHTIIPGFLTQGQHAVGPFGVMGGFMQPQGHVQVILNTLRYGMNPQQALDAPRWQWTSGKTVEVEHGLGASLSRALAARGHDLKVQLDPGAFGRGQIIWRDAKTGVLSGGSESRADGQAAAF
ncbi:gamma-glutamyltransferase family protein [Deinococcus deserti]|uniref:Putative gamma-glutamyltransferase (Gamma-glutamyl transpeptidase) n=1 Tax=Deinococcus deserti (strain DSM 17065 / CIP 109153 / LMG 22923 / VCD115) TaxID=546414 RepID=C1D2F5_DEIDV|nr:gamma-glutamyltransferase family protein [Deinococcus deserti]ACO47594.1 putative gamma-glutamyltransferase (Gamma-glutamyl transpeptidase) [Deinococcus deserti VCD115]